VKQSSPPCPCWQFYLYPASLGLAISKTESRTDNFKRYPFLRILLREEMLKRLKLGRPRFRVPLPPLGEVHLPGCTEGFGHFLQYLIRWDAEPVTAVFKLGDKFLQGIVSESVLLFLLVESWLVC